MSWTIEFHLSIIIKSCPIARPGINMRFFHERLCSLEVASGIRVAPTFHFSIKRSGRLKWLDSYCSLAKADISNWDSMNSASLRVSTSGIDDSRSRSDPFAAVDTVAPGKQYE